MARRASRTTANIAHQAHQRLTGFTIVELLIVVVVIAILAAITIVAYNGINDAARESALKSELTQQAKAVELWKTQNGEVYPVDYAAAIAAGLFRDTTVADFRSTHYIVSPDRKNYCITALPMGITNLQKEYSVTSTSSAPIRGECVTNLVTNPSFETGTNTWMGDASTITQSSSDKYSGDWSLYVPTLSVPTSGAMFYMSTTPGSAYMVSAWVKTPVARAIHVQPMGGGGTPTSVPSGAWTRKTSVNFTASAASTLMYVSSGDVTNPFYIDDVLGTQGPYLYTYGDGDSPGWFWNGEPHNSTSTGPAIPL